jgi:alanine racemase
MSAPSYPPARPLRCWAEIDLAALERNLRLIRASLPPHMRYVAVVKADAYGHGLHQTAARLMHAGADLFAVANVDEAAALREIGPGWPVLVLGPLLPGEEAIAVEGGFIATLSSLEEVSRLDDAARAMGRPVSVHVKIDTGMGRAGVWHEAAPLLFARLATAHHLRLAGIYTHFASPDDDLEFTAEQRRRFLATMGRCVGTGRSSLLVHADNSAGIETLPGAGPFNAVRIGLLQFGVLPHPHSLLAQVRTEPVFSFHTRVGLVKKLPRGTTISYGRTHELSRDSTVAILCAGYADGLPRAASNRTQVLLHGRRCPVLGRITMDQTVVDVSSVDGIVTCGDEAILVGRQEGHEITLAEFSRAADTIPWETLTSVTKRVPRVYKTALGV